MERLTVHNFSKKYASFTAENISFAVKPGSIVGLIGENGAGKSTVIKSILGLVQPGGGDILFDGRPINSLTTAQRQQIAFVMDNAALPAELTVLTLEKALRKIYLTWNRDKFFGLVKQWELPKDRQIKKFSKGMKMKLAIICALCHGSRLLVLDEPTGGLDPVVRNEILDLMYDYSGDGDRAILLSSHITADLEKICDYIVYLHKGKVAVAGEKDLLLEQFAVYGMDYKYISELDKYAVVRVIKRDYGADILAHKAKMPKGFSYRPASLDDFMLFFSKGEEL